MAIDIQGAQEGEATGARMEESQEGGGVAWGSSRREEWPVAGGKSDKRELTARVSDILSCGWLVILHPIMNNPQTSCGTI